MYNLRLVGAEHSWDYFRTLPVEIRPGIQLCDVKSPKRGRRPKEEAMYNDRMLLGVVAAQVFREISDYWERESTGSFIGRT